MNENALLCGSFIMAQQLFGNWRTDVSFSKQEFLLTIVGDYQ